MTKFRRAYDFSRFHKDATVWFFPEFINGCAGAAIKVQVALSLNNENKHKGTLLAYVEADNHLQTRFATDGIIEKADEEIRTFRQGEVTTWDFSQNVSCLALRCSSVYEK